MVINILFVVEFYHPYIGSMGTLFKNLCEGLAKRGHKVIVATIRLANTSKHETLNGVDIVRVSVPSKNENWQRYWFTFLAIPAVLRLSKQVDIIHTTTYNGAFPAWIASKILRKPCVITIHEVWGKLWNEFSGMSKLSASIHQLFEKMIINLGFTKYIGVSNSTVNQIGKLGKEAITIYNGIDYEFFNPKNYNREEIRKLYGFDNKFVYLFYGRCGLSKGLEYLVDAIPQISKTIPNSLCYLIVSKEPKDIREKIELKVKSLGISAKMTSPVPYAILPHQIIASDCVIVPSLSEGFGFSATEACAMGIPVVASNCTSLPEVVSGKYVLVEPRNSDAIVKGILDVYRGRIKISKLKRFTWNDCVEKHIELYKEVLKI